MGLLDRLRELGGKVGLLTVEAGPTAAAPQKIKMRTVSLPELATEVRADEVRALAELPAELTVSFEKIFEAAGVKPAAHGWTVERLRQLLKTAQYKEMPREAAQQALLGLLAAEQADVADVVKDAVGRDQALDAFEKFVHDKVDHRNTARERRIAELESKIKDLEEEKAKAREEQKNDEARWLQWRAKKRAHEKELAWAVGFLMDKPVVTLDE